MRHPTAFAAIYGAVIVAQAAWAFQVPCQDEGKRVLESLTERWEWEAFWDGKTSGFQYQPRGNATTEVFWNPGFSGMCSLEIGACTAYERNGVRLGRFTLSEPLRGVRLRQATEVFLRKLNEQRVVSEDRNAGPRDKIEGAGHWESGATVLSIPAPRGEVVVRRDAGSFQTCTINTSFPRLDSPKSIRDKITPEDLSAFQQWLEGRLHPPAGATSEYVIPYYGSNDPMVYVLVRVNGTTESVIFAVADPRGTGWRLGGHFDPKESPTQVQRLEPLILSGRMTSVSH